jgi:hypothetical protein
MTIINDLRREELANVQACEDFNYDDQQTHRVFYWDVGIKMHNDVRYIWNRMYLTPNPNGNQVCAWITESCVGRVCWGERMKQER